MKLFLFIIFEKIQFSRIAVAIAAFVPALTMANSWPGAELTQPTFGSELFAIIINRALDLEGELQASVNCLDDHRPLAGPCVVELDRMGSTDNAHYYIGNGGQVEARVFLGNLVCRKIVKEDGSIATMSTNLNPLRPAHGVDAICRQRFNALPKERRVAILQVLAIFHQAGKTFSESEETGGKQLAVIETLRRLHGVQ